ncbi:hypothetical protein G9A89_022841 [Geosiphon pyriformis]|nr:hypothetical protein G9A89_022841 [Geosiphon pyriformis]
MIKKKALKSAFHGLAKGFFFQKKKVTLRNIKHSGDEKNVFLVKLGSSDSIYSNVDSLSGNNENVDMASIGSKSLLGSATTTLKAKQFNTSVDFGSSNFVMNDIEIILPLHVNFSLKKKWIDPKITKVQVKIPVKKSFALDINLSAVEKKSAMVKTQLIRKIFSTINGFGGATTLLKFKEIIRSTFTLEESMKKAILLARKKEITINSDLKKQKIHSDWAIVIKEILMNMPKKMIIATVSEFGNIKSIKIQLIGMWQKTMIIIPYWEKLSACDYGHKKSEYLDTLLFTLPVRMTAHDLSTLLEKASEKTCVINCSLETGNQTHCIIIGFKSENELESAFYTEPIFGGMRFFWARLDLKFKHLALEYNASDTLVSALSRKNFIKNAFDVNCLQLVRLYVKKNVLIFYPATFIVFSASFSGGLLFESGSGSFFFGISGLGDSSPFVLTNNFSLNACLASLERSLELLGDQVSGILHKLGSMKLVSLAPLPSSGHLVALINVNLDSNLDIVLDNSVVMPVPLSVVPALGLSSLKILTTKVGCLEFKLVTLEALIGSVLKIATCNVREMNNSAKQENIICWHLKSNNMIKDKFNGIRIFTFGLKVGFLEETKVATKAPNLTVVEFCHAFYLQYQSDFGLPEECFPAENALTYYINARINYHIGREEEPNNTKHQLYRKLSQFTTKKTTALAMTIVQIHYEIEQYTNKNYPISTKNTRKHVVQSVKKQCLHSPKERSYHFSPDNKIQLPLGAVLSSTLTSQMLRTPNYTEKDIPITEEYSLLFQKLLFQPKFRAEFENCEEKSESESEETSKKTSTRPVTETSSQSKNQKTCDQEEELDIREATFRNTQRNIILLSLRPINSLAENNDEIATPYIMQLMDFLGEKEETDMHTWLKEAQKAI